MTGSQCFIGGTEAADFWLMCPTGRLKFSEGEIKKSSKNAVEHILGEQKTIELLIFDTAKILCLRKLFALSSFNQI